MYVEPVARRCGDAAGTAAKTAEVMDSGIGGASRRLLSAVEGVAIAVGDALAPALSDLAEWLAETTGKITKWVEGHKDIIITGLKVAAVIMGIGAAMMVFAHLVGLVGSVITAIRALSAAVLFLAANPMVALLAIIAAAAIAIGLLSLKINKAITASQKAREEIGKELTAMDARRQEDIARLDTLKAILEKQERTTEEQQRASTIAAELESRYGKIGVIWDKVGNAVGIAADSTERMTKAMREQRKLALQIEHARVMAEFDKVVAAKRAAGDVGALAGGVREAGSWIGMATSPEQERRAFSRELTALRKIEKNIREQIEKNDKYNPATSDAHRAVKAKAKQAAQIKQAIKVKAELTAKQEKKEERDAQARWAKRPRSGQATRGSWRNTPRDTNGTRRHPRSEGRTPAVLATSSAPSARENGPSVSSAASARAKASSAPPASRACKPAVPKRPSASPPTASTRTPASCATPKGSSTAHRNRPCLSP